MGKDITTIQIINTISPSRMKGPKIVLSKTLIASIMSDAGIFDSTIQKTKKRTIRKRRIKKKLKKRKRRSKKTRLLIDLPARKKHEMEIALLKKIKAIENGSFISKLKPFDPELMNPSAKFTMIKSIRDKLSHRLDIEKFSQAFHWQIKTSKIVKKFFLRNCAQRNLFEQQCIGMERELNKLEQYIQGPESLEEFQSCKNLAKNSV